MAITLPSLTSIASWRLISLAAALLIILAHWPLHAQGQMTFTGDPPQQPEMLYGNAWQIFADGPIDPSAPARLKAFLDRNQVAAHSVLYLNSPGGSLLAGMEMGRIIRKYNLFTQVNSIGQLDTTLGSNRHKTTSGSCLSACKRLSFYFIFDPLKRGEEVLSMGAQSLLINDDPVSVTKLKIRPAQLINGWINAEYRSTPELLQKVRGAKTVGIAFQFFDGHPMFLGYQGMEISTDARKKMDGIVSMCR